MRRGAPLRAAVGMLACVGLLGVTACSNEGADLLSDLVPPMDPGQDVSLALHVQPLFTLNCAVGGCHDAATAESGLVLEAGRLFDPQTGIVSVPSRESPLPRVAPFDSSGSYLVHKLLGTQGATGSGDPMPFGGPPLSADAIQVIRDWIDQGARDN